MTNKEAIEILTGCKRYVSSEPEKMRMECKEALDLAIKALEEHPTDKEIQDDMRRTYLGGKE